jgi:polysaccharide chain length determinant protein (PEP-CTERM system associated)
VSTHLEEPAFDPIAVVRRRFWSLLLPLVAGGIVGVLLVLLLPREYVASATLAVTTPNVTGDLAKVTPQDFQERIRALSQELLSRPVIEQVAREEGLLDGRNVDDVVASMRGRTTVALPVKTLAAGREPDTFIVSYAGPTADEAQRVTNRLLNVFIARDSSQRESRAKETSGFLGDQLRESERRMDEAEIRLRKLKESHTGVLPEQALANLQAMSDVRQRADSNADALRGERDRLSTLELQIDQMRRDMPTDTRTDDEIKADDRVVTLERQLAAAQRQYTARHPEIQRIEVELNTARSEQVEARAQGAQARTAPRKADQTLQQLTAERDRVKGRIRELQTVGARLPEELATYQARVDQAPIIEQQLQPLEQAYELEKAQHQRLVERYQAALIAESLETRRAGGQFAILYPAPLPGMPSRPNVPRVLAFSLLAGAVLGGVLAFLRESLDKTVHDARTLQLDFDQAVLAEIPNVRRKRA